jgi:hypothetical protein
MSDVDLKPEQWVYAGVRDNAGKRSHAWIDEQDVERWYSDKSTFVIGGIYDVKVSRTPGTSTPDSVRRATPVYTGQKVDQAQRQAMFTQDHLAKVSLARALAERKDAKVDELERALRPLIDIAATLRSQYDRDAFAALVLRQINTAWR